MKAERPLVPDIFIPPVIIRSRELAQSDLGEADVIIRPETVRTRLLDFSAKLQNIAAGAQLVSVAIERSPQIMRDAARRKTARLAPAT